MEGKLVKEKVRREEEEREMEASGRGVMVGIRHDIGEARKWRVI